jgi:hypothetical protein
MNHGEGELTMGATGRSLIRAWRWISNQVVQDVPEEIMVCEYDCRKAQCTMAEAERCEKRQQEGAGELFPLVVTMRRARSHDLYSLPADLLRASDTNTVHI